MSERVLPAFLEVHLDGACCLVPVEKVLADANLRGQVTSKALSELEAWRDRYGELLTHIGDREAREFVRAFDRLKRSMGDRWPTLPDDVLEG